MGQFKPMVKMMTTEPSVELKLKKGGSVKSMTKMKSEDKGSGHKKMAGGGAMGALAGTPALVGRPAVNAPVKSPGKPSMAARRKAMTAKPKMATPMMKKGGKTEKLDKEIRNESEEIGRVKAKLTKHEDMAASKAHKGLKSGGMACATGGVTLGQGGYKKGGNVKKYAKGGLAGNGIIPESASARGGEAYKNTKMHTAEYTGKTSGKTGGVKNGNGGGYKTGGVILGQGGYKDGGKAKKAYATGGKVEDSGRPVAMPQGRKKPSTPVSINQLAGTFKKGGKVTPAEGRLMKNFSKENAPAMKAAKAQSNEVYSKYGKMKMAEGGAPEKYREGERDLSNGAYDAAARHSMELEDAMNPLSMMKELAGKAKKYFMPKGSESVTKTKESVTVTPGKKRAGGAC
jgi:hypothetical protein